MADSCKIKYYIAAHDEDALKEAITSDADVIVMDLEQNCPADKKEAGRALMQRACAEMDFKGSAKWIRVNIGGSKEQEEDLESLEHLPDGIVLASAQDAQETLGLAKALVDVERRVGVAPGTITDRAEYRIRPGSSKYVRNRRMQRSDIRDPAWAAGTC